jgi:peptidoglycan hydrolase CwlO-like protein
MPDDESPTVHINGDGEPVVVKEIPAQDEHQNDQEGKQWQPAFSEMQNLLAELKSNQETEAAKFSAFQSETENRLTELQARPQSTPESSPPEPATPPANHKEPETSGEEKPAKPESESSESAKPEAAAEKFRTVVRRRRSI